MSFALGVVLAFGFIWAGMAFFMNWQKDAPMAQGLGDIHSEHYQEGIENNLRQQRAQAAFFRRTLWPVLIACGATCCVLIVLLNV